jgi:glutamate N-acetyltransferase/amino-acid N-acetyltransferase
MAALAAAQLSLSPKQVAVGSTGVIGHVLDMAKVERGILDACAAASEDPAPFMDAILTTDLVEKWASWASEDQVLRVPGDTVPSTSGPKVFGVAKGSGMMAPNMATMLSYVVTDYDASEIDLSALLRSVASRSFNSMTVDGDTSTNDMLLLFANGASGIKPTFEQLEGAVGEVCVSLAKQIAKDGEGATKLVEVQVTGSGRVLMAAGRAGVPFEPRAARLALIIRGEEHLLFDHGTPASFDPDKVSAALKSDHVLIDLRLGEGETATVYTCDFGYGYVRINAEYHT